MKKLITMTEYVIWLKDYKGLDVHVLGDAKRYWKGHKYAKLLQTPLELGQFIPCKDGEPMEKPSKWGAWENGTLNLSHLTKSECMAYQMALESVLFKGWAFGNNGFLVNEFGGCIGVRTDKGFTFLHKDTVPNWKTIEDIIRDFELTPCKACKEIIGLNQ